MIIKSSLFQPVSDLELDSHAAAADSPLSRESNLLIRSDLAPADNELWMTATQFERILDRTEAAENMKARNVASRCDRKSSFAGKTAERMGVAPSQPSRSQNKSNGEPSSSPKSSAKGISYLDQEARTTFDKMKKVSRLLASWETVLTLSALPETHCLPSAGGAIGRH